MNESVTYADVLVKVELRSPHKTVVIAVNEEFGDKVVMGLEAWIQRDRKSIKIVFEDESFRWIDCPQDAFIYRTYTQIAVDDEEHIEEFEQLEE